MCHHHASRLNENGSGHCLYTRCDVFLLGWNHYNMTYIFPWAQEIYGSNWTYFKVRYKEHKNGTGKKKGRSDLVHCMLENTNSYGEIDNGVEILRYNMIEYY
jgi:hypothetical protein